MKHLLAILALTATGCGTCGSMHLLYRDARAIVIESGACDRYRYEADCPALQRLQESYFEHAPPCPTQ